MTITILGGKDKEKNKFVAMYVLLGTPSHEVRDAGERTSFELRYESSLVPWFFYLQSGMKKFHTLQRPLQL